MSSGTARDMIVLDNLCEETILENLRARYFEDVIYTYTGSILVAVNPFKKLPIYETEFVTKYHKKSAADNDPHIFAIAEAAFQNIRRDKDSQSIIVSGESGSGKTESTKYVLQYLTSVASVASHQDSWIEQQILEANKVLESFGNAKTVKNNNSSRFGKFIHLHFDEKTRIVGASIENYLLEKTRIIRPNQGERGYHVFYEFLTGATEEEVEKYQLLPPDQFEYLKMSGTYKIDGVDDNGNFERLKLALQVLKFSADEQDYILRTLAIILWLGNIGFTQKNDRLVQITNMVAVEKVASLLNITSSVVQDFLLVKKLVIRGDVTQVPYNQMQAQDNRDSTSKALYTIMFDFVTSKMNELLKGLPNYTCAIGILDIFGFECFETNSFEQLCINYTNEKLQQQFNHVIFKFEQHEYSLEGISLESIRFRDNQLCLDMIESKPLGLLFLLDEESRFPKGTDASWLSKVEGQWSKNQHFNVAPLKKNEFTVKHYAGDVRYQIESFLEKNRDFPSENIVNFLSMSQVSTLAITASKQKPLFSSNTKQTISVQFRSQLVNLIQSISNTSVHYVRCIRPNASKVANEFTEDMVMSQLRYTGMLDTIKIRKSGYSKRFLFNVFIDKFYCLVPMADSKSEHRDQCLAIFNRYQVPGTRFKLGKTKVFMKEQVLEVFETLKFERQMKSALIVQKILRGFSIRAQYKRLLKTCVLIQRYVRGFLARVEAKRRLAAVITIQAVARGWFARDYKKKLLEEIEQEKRRQEELRLKMLEELRIKQEEEALKAALETEIPKSPAPEIIFTEEEMAEAMDTIAEDIKSLNTEDSPVSPVSTLKARRKSSITVSITQSSVSDAASSLVSPTRRMSANPLAKRLSILSNNASIPEEMHPLEEWFSITNNALFTQGYNPHDYLQLVFRYDLSLQPKPIFNYDSEKCNNDALEIAQLVCSTIASDGLDSQFLPNCRKIIEIGIFNPEIRDEILLQCLKQTREPFESPSSWLLIHENAWRLFTLVCCCLPGSKEFSKYYVNFLNSIKSSSNEILRKYIGFALNGIKNVLLNGPRALPPSNFEYQSVKNVLITIPFWFLDDTMHQVQINSSTCVADIVKELTTRGELSEPNTWSLYQTFGDHEVWMKPSDYIMDVVAEWELDNAETLRQAKRRSILESRPLQLETNFKFCLKRRIFKSLSIKQLPNHELRLIYAQTVIEVIKDFFKIPDEYLIRMCGLNLRILCSPQEDLNDFLNSRFSSFLPARIVANQGYWNYRILLNFTENWKDYTISAAIQEYMKLATSLRQWGTSFYLAYYRGLQSDSNRIFVGVSTKGLEFVSSETREPLMMFRYAQVRSYECVDQMFSIVTISEDASSEDLLDADDHEVYQFSCDQALDLMDLLREYHPMITRTRTSISHQPLIDMETLQKYIEKAKSDLQMAKVLYSDDDKSSASKVSVKSNAVDLLKTNEKKRLSFLPTGLNILKKSSKRTSITSTILPVNFEKEDEFKFTLHKQRHALSKNAFKEANDWSVNLNETLLYLFYSELPSEDAIIPLTGRNDVPRYILLAFKNQTLTDELFLQLIRFVSEYPKEHATRIAKFWQVFAICAGCLHASPLVFNYVTACLRRVANLVPKRWNQTDIAFARFCLRNMQKMQNIERNTAPTLVEMSIHCRMTALKVKIGLSDGQAKTLGFDVYSLVSDVLGRLVRVLDLNAAKEYSLYRFINGREHQLNDKVPMIEYFGLVADSNDYSQRTLFVLRRRVITSLMTPNSVEYQLLSEQTLADVKRGFIPLSVDRVCHVTALALQYHHGDAGQGKVNYVDVINRYMPIYFISEPGLIEKLSIEYNRLKGMDPAVALDQLMCELEKCPEFGCRGFYVQQTFKKTIPKNCCLVINSKGIFISSDGKSFIFIEHGKISGFVPSADGILIASGTFVAGEKYMFVSPYGQGFEIGEVLKEYQEGQ